MFENVRLNKLIWTGTELEALKKCIYENEWMLAGAQLTIQLIDKSCNWMWIYVIKEKIKYTILTRDVKVCQV